jgi:dTDP-4-dehydrorhamnose 3,5-epimerase
VVLEDDTVFAYKVDNYYSPKNDRGIAFDDESLSIDWTIPDGELNLSVKDRAQPTLNEAIDIFEYGVNYYA